MVDHNAVLAAIELSSRKTRSARSRYQGFGEAFETVLQIDGERF